MIQSQTLTTPLEWLENHGGTIKLCGYAMT